MISGHILLTIAGVNLASIEKERRNVVVKNFCDMRDKAFGEWKDKFYADYGKNNIVELYSHCCERPSYWEGVDTKVIQLLQQTFSNFPIHVNVEYFCNQPEPRTEGGFDYQGHPVINYVYDCSSLENWHNVWNRNHTDLIEWESEIFPFKSKIIEIMKKELECISGDSINYNPSERKDLLRMQNHDYKSDNDVVNCFHNLIIKHKSASGEGIAYVKIMGEEICNCNGYHREQELERLEEKEGGNNHAERIYSIKKKNGEFIFLCIDKQHGMLEWCDDKGNHQGEVRFDGSPNKPAKPDHGLKYVAEWKRLYNR